MAEKLTLKQQALQLLPQLVRLELNLADEKLSDKTKFSLLVHAAAALYQSLLSSEEDSKEDDDVMMKINLEIIFQHIYHYIDNKSIDVNQELMVALGCPELLYLLLRRGADSNFVDSLGSTPLHHIAGSSPLSKFSPGINHLRGINTYLESIKLLCAFGARSDIKNRKGLTWLECSSAERRAEFESLSMQKFDRLDLIEKWERPYSEMPAVNENPTFSYTEEEKAKLDFFRQEKYGVLLRSAQNSLFFGSRKVYLGPKGRITLMDKTIDGAHVYSSIPSQQLQYVFAAEKQEALTKFVNELIAKFPLSDVDEQITLLNAIKGEYSVLTAKKIESMGCEEQIYGLHFLMRKKPEATSIVNQWEFLYEVSSAVIAETIGLNRQDLENDSCIDAIYQHVSVMVDEKIKEIKPAENVLSY